MSKTKKHPTNRRTTKPIRTRPFPGYRAKALGSHGQRDHSRDCRVERFRLTTLLNWYTFPFPKHPQVRCPVLRSVVLIFAFIALGYLAYTLSPSKKAGTGQQAEPIASPDNPVTLPEGDWTPPSFSEQKGRKQKQGDASNVPSGQSSGQDDIDPAEVLTIIESPRLSERGSTLRRFRFILGELPKYCPVTEGNASHADMLASVFVKLEDAGLEREEGLLALTNNLYGLTVEAAGIAKLNGYPAPPCHEVWALYLTLRLRGQLRTAAREAVAKMIGGLYGIGVENDHES